MKNWQLQEAKAHFSELVQSAVKEGPQGVTLRGEPTVVVIAQKDYEKLSKRKPSFVDFMRQSPLVGVKLELSRNKTSSRDVEL